MLYIIFPLVKAIRNSLKNPNIDLINTSMIRNIKAAIISSLKGILANKWSMVENKNPPLESGPTPTIELNTGNKAAKLIDSKSATRTLNKRRSKNDLLCDFKK